MNQMESKLNSLLELIEDYFNEKLEFKIQDFDEGKFVSFKLHHNLKSMEISKLLSKLMKSIGNELAITKFDSFNVTDGAYMNFHLMPNDYDQIQDKIFYDPAVAFESLRDDLPKIDEPKNNQESPKTNYIKW